MSPARPCEHPDDALVELYRFGTPTGQARCRSCGAVIALSDTGEREISGL